MDLPRQVEKFFEAEQFDMLDEMFTQKVIDYESGLVSDSLTTARDTIKMRITSKASISQESEGSSGNHENDMSFEND